MKSKKLLLGLLSIIIVLGCEKNNETNEIKNNTQSAKLKRILLYLPDDSEQPLKIVDEYEYDSLNRVYKVSSPMYEDGKIVGTIKYDLYEYNAQGQLAKVSTFNASLNSPSGFANLKNYIYSYSKSGLKNKELIEYPAISSFEYTLYTYSGKKLTKAEKYGDNEKLEA